MRPLTIDAWSRSRRRRGSKPSLFSGRLARRGWWMLRVGRGNCDGRRQTRRDGGQALCLGRNQKRAPIAKGERTTCAIAVVCSPCMPVGHAHWRHKAGDCDAWSEPGALASRLNCRHVVSRDRLARSDDGELHRADVLVGSGTPLATVLEAAALLDQRGRTHGAGGLLSA